VHVGALKTQRKSCFLSPAASFAAKGHASRIHNWKICVVLKEARECADEKERVIKKITAARRGKFAPLKAGGLRALSHIISVCARCSFSLSRRADARTRTATHQHRHMQRTQYRNHLLKTRHGAALTSSPNCNL
jgi:hypothetical protein